MGDQYPKPPVREAVCEFHFAEPDPDPTVAGVLRAHVQEEYDGQPRADQTFQVGAEQSTAQFSVRPRSTAIRIPSEDETRMLTLMQTIFAVHRMAPYGGWKKQFFPQIEWAWEKYKEVFPRPRPISRVVLRYLNTIVITEASVSLHDYFNKMPDLPPPLSKAGATLSALALRYSSGGLETDGEEYSTMVSVGFATPNSAMRIPPGHFLLDIDVTRAWEPEHLLDGSPIPHLGALKEREREVFESIITDKTRELFQ